MDTFNKAQQPEFTRADAMHLWQYFSDRADMLKDRLWTIGTWLLGFNSAILAFILGSQITLDATGVAIQSPLVVLILSLSGCYLCLYARLLIKDYHEHIERSWARANLLKEKLPLVQDVLKETAAKEGQTKDKPNQKQPRVAQILHRFTMGYLCLFLLLVLLALTLLLSNVAAI